jgi:hypothetical protein
MPVTRLSMTELNIVDFATDALKNLIIIVIG